jgi:hypothetical protein
MKHLTRSEREKLELAHDIVVYLNTLIAADGEAMHALVEYRAPCNQTMTNHPTAQVSSPVVSEGSCLGLLGVLNGLVGVDAGSWGYIASNYDDDGKLRYFSVRNPGCKACAIEAEIGTEEVPHPIDARLHTCLLRVEACTPSP